MSKIVKPLLVGCILVIMLLPLLNLGFSSFKTQNDFYQSARMLLTGKLTFENYIYIFTKMKIGQYLINSLSVTILVTAASVVFGSLAAFALSRLPYRWLTFVVLFIVMVRFYPKITTIIPYYILMKDLKMLDTIGAIVLAQTGLFIPFVVLLMTTFYSDLPKEIEESCRIDGANIAQSYMKIIVPMTAGGMAASAILTAQLSWNEFLFASAVSSVKSQTLPIAITSFLTDKGLNLGALSAMSVVIVLPIVLFIFFSQRFLVQGLTLGSVKG
ncbi:hypothetical protein SY83_13465 [Paenibacillus swuensis]|uniref:ABC transmembrane type-1 domain-containing protein n=1 Tax=Paenibacillus swuensis TaxID=1178515 RepID=A0A172TJF8_9BACL|nr:carbohydrate ABC transporter permease [Paenibacillus swuensis]ANE47102.1 hypothetical protein SY83_13465 [Paenibacillus swuensis]